MKILIATSKPFAKEVLKDMIAALSPLDHELVILDKYLDKRLLLKAVENADAIIVRSDTIDKEVIDHSKGVKIIIRAGAGVDNIDIEYAKEKGICVMNTPGQNANAVAELVFGLTLYAIRNFYNGTMGHELLGKNIGIHAYGNVGRYVAKIAKGFGMTVYAYDPYLKASEIEKDGVKALQSEVELYAKCQFVSVHLPFTSKTNQTINYDLMSKMPIGSTLINTARQQIINETDLERLMKERPDFRYVSDIAPKNNNCLAALFPDRYYATPIKMGAQTFEANHNAGVAAAKQLVRYFLYEDETYKLN